jgi:hypothetical protein
LLLYLSHLPLGVPNGLVIYQASSIFSGTVAGEQRRIISLVNWAPSNSNKIFSGAVAGEENKDFCEGSFSRAHPLLCFKFCFTLFILLASFYQKPKKIESFVVVFIVCF